jgi:hypothetical protein
MIRIETRACYGTCPEYSLAVSFDGKVAYEGRHCVIRKGAAGSRLTEAELAKLKKAIEKSGFWGLATSCCNCRELTDAPWTIIEVTKSETDRARKTIEHYYGCRSAPKAVSQLEETIISITRATKWIGTEQERTRQKWKRNRC